MTCSSWLTSICKQSVSMYVTAWWSQPAATAQGACNLCHYLIHRHMSCLGRAWGLLRPYLKQILCQHSYVVEMAQSVSLNLSTPQMYHICQPMSTCHLDWSEGKALGQKGCNSSIGMIEYSTFPSTSQFWCIMWLPVFLKQAQLQWVWTVLLNDMAKTAGVSVHLLCSHWGSSFSQFNKCSQWISLQFCDFHPLRDINSQLEVCGSCMLVVSYKKLYSQYNFSLLDTIHMHHFFGCHVFIFLSVFSGFLLS